jgi:hypothetical protein
MRLLLVASLLFASAALADVITEDVAACRDKSAGAPCKTESGAAGTCVETMVSRPDYSNGPPPTYRQVKMLECRATAGAAKKQAFDWRPWLGVALTAIALLAALATRGRRRVPA